MSKGRKWKAYAWIEHGASRPYFVTRPGAWTRKEALKSTRSLFESLIRVTITETRPNRVTQKGRNK